MVFIVLRIDKEDTLSSFTTAKAFIFGSMSVVEGYVDEGFFEDNDQIFEAKLIGTIGKKVEMKRIEKLVIKKRE